MFARPILPILAVATGLVLAPGPAQSQQPSAMARIGYLSPVTAAADAANRSAFAAGLRDLGYVEGRNLRIVARHADGLPDRLSGLAAELSRERVDVIVAATTTAVRAAQLAAPATPIVMAFAGDPVGDGLVASLARPGGNTTGLSAAVTEIAAKRVEYLHAIAPRSSRFLLLDPPGASNSMVAASEAAATALGFAIVTIRVRSEDDVARALASGRAGGIDGIIVDLALPRYVAQIVDVAARERIPTASGPREFTVDGGLLAYGANYPDLFRRAASYVDRILRGAKPADLPVEQSTKFHLVVNLRTAKAIGATIPPSLLSRADELIR